MFLTVSFLIAAGLAAVIPVLLHLLLRSRPVRVSFPAFDFLRRREKTVQRKMTLQHLLLLFFRCAVFLLLGLALARPSCRPETQQAVNRGDGPVAAVLVVDTSVRMGILAENQSRLDKAQETARRILAGLPPGSEAAVLDTAAASDFFQVDLLAAREAVDRLKPGGSLRSLADTVAEGVRLLNKSGLANRELFIFTDKTAAGWPEASRIGLNQLLADQSKQAPIAFYLADCSTAASQEGGIVSAAVTPAADASDPARVDLELIHQGAASSGTVEFWLLDPAESSADGGLSLEGGLSPESRFSAQKTFSAPVTFEESAEPAHQTMTFYPPNLPDGFSLGYVRLLPDDAFGADNCRWFAVHRGSAAKILLAASDPVEEKGLFVQEALAPNGTSGVSGGNSYEAALCSTADLEAMPQEELAAYPALFLLDPERFSADLTARLSRYLNSGGGIALFLGKQWRNGEENQADSEEAEQLSRFLGGTLTGPVRRAGKGVLWVPGETEHPILAEFRPLIRDAAVPWTELPIFRYWKFTPASLSSFETVLRFSDSSPALISRTVGAGVMVLSMTPFSDSPARPDAWNHLTAGENAWVFLMLTDGIARTLVSGGGQTSQIYPGETALLRPNWEPFPDSALLELPNGEQVQIPTDTEHRLIRFSGRTDAGPYRIAAEKKSEKNLPTGFCVNYPASEYDLTERTAEQIESYLAPFPLKTAADTAAVATDRFSRHFGREFYPFIILLLGLVLAAETILSNRFYQ